MNAPVRIGEIVASKYRVERVLGVGGMGAVVAARHLQLGSRVAIKFMIPTTLDAGEASSRFVREARAAARLNSEYVTRVSDFGVLETGVPYIVMEFIEGVDLDAVLKVRGPLPIRDVLGYMIDVCKAMAEAHAAGIIHRDLKTKNLLLTHRFDGTPIVKVADFGISKLTEATEGSDLGSTRTGELLGSPGFMAPEQMLNSRDVDARADIYALGAIAFRLVTGRMPFQAASVAEMVGAVLHKDPRTVRSLRADVPIELEAIIMRCLQRSPDDRYSNVIALMTALQSIGNSAMPMDIAGPESAAPPGSLRESARSPELSGHNTVGDVSIPSLGERDRHSKSTFAMVLGAVVIVGALALLAARGFGVPAQPAAPPPLAPGGGTVVATPVARKAIQPEQTPFPPAATAATIERDVDAAVVEKSASRPSTTASPSNKRSASPHLPLAPRPPDSDLLK